MTTNPKTGGSSSQEKREEELVVYESLAENSEHTSLLEGSVYGLISNQRYPTIMPLDRSGMLTKVWKSICNIGEPSIIPLVSKYQSLHMDGENKHTNNQIASYISTKSKGALQKLTSQAQISLLQASSSNRQGKIFTFVEQIS